MSLSLGFSLSLGNPIFNKGGGGKVLRAVGTKGQPFAMSFVPTAANVRIESRSVHTLAYACKRIKYLYGGYYAVVSGTNPLFQPLPANLPIQVATKIGATISQATFAGALQGSIPAGAGEYSTDWIDAETFGLSIFPAGQQIEHRYQSDAVVGSRNCYNQAGFYAGESGVVGNGTGASQLLSTAALSGSATTGPVNPLAIIAELSDGQVAVINTGTSIDYGQGDPPRGYFRRAMESINGGVLPYTNFGVQSSLAKQFIGSSYPEAVYKYFSHGYSGYGTNDLAGGQTAAQTITSLRTMWTRYKSAPGSKIRHVENGLVIPRTTSASGNWISDADQTPISGFETGGTLRDPLNAAIIANVGADGLDGYVDVSAPIQSLTAPDKWISTGANRYATSDGVHPNSLGHTLMDAPLRARAETWA